MERSTPHMHAAIGGMWTCLYNHGRVADGIACMVEDGGVWGMAVVVCGRCEDDDDGSGVCMVPVPVVGWWVTHMAFVPCA